MWTVDQIKNLLQTNDRAVTRGLLTIYARQTADEQSSEQTRHHNGVGFSAFDAPFLSSLALQLCQGRTLSVRQMEISRKRIQKYARQLAEVANAREKEIA